MTDIFRPMRSIDIAKALASRDPNHLSVIAITIDALATSPGFCGAREHHRADRRE
ncbi:hypothetical protein ACFQZO_26795 [Bradyrhizobium sp. GCM10027634]|uniref:hypothetical protein n=1 Tax=unclassified Bradyrhizobium TaxID=2631580 RepID=UPI00188D2FE4|nr:MULTISPECIES: hypothetical protein [unclassified Bradyrhizobium]MDN5004459.1 hypothetical protein [Bradyrhizobium sp. WYCCWR 12677]